MRKPFLQLHTAVLLAGLTGVMGRLISLSEGLLVWYRMLFTMAALWILHLLSQRRTSKATHLPMLTGGIVALHWVFFYASIKYANVSVGLLCFSSVGFFTALLNPLFTRQKLDPAELALGSLVMLGIWLMFQVDASFKIGILLGLISALLATLFTLLNKRLLDKYTPGELTLYEMTGGWLLLTLLLPAYLYFFPQPSLLPSLPDLFWLLLLSLLCTVWAFHLSLRALSDISAFTVNLSYNLEPVYGIALAFLLFREHKELSSGFYYGMLLIFIAVILQTFRVWKKKTA